MEVRSPPNPDGIFTYSAERKKKGFIKKDGKYTSGNIPRKPIAKSSAPKQSSMKQPSSNFSSVKQPSSNTSESGRKRLQSFATIVSNATGSLESGEQYYISLNSTITRRDGLETSSYVTLYQIDVQRGDKSWTIYRRHRQFVELDRTLKKKGVLPLSDNTIPKKGNFDKPKTEEETQMRIKELRDYLVGLMTNNSTSQSHYFLNFLEPTQVGDSKKS